MNRTTVLSALVLALAGAPAPGAAEHPTEHPAEHPATAPATRPVAQAVTKEALAEAIAAYVKADAALHGGYFLVYDKEKDKVLALTLDKVHKDRLSKVGENRYFACADFRDRDGTTYDLDIFMEGPDAAHLKTTQILVHKENGVARYNWKQDENGLWVTVPAGEKTERRSAEHPERRPASRPEHPAEHPAEHPR